LASTKTPTPLEFIVEEKPTSITSFFSTWKLYNINLESLKEIQTNFQNLKEKQITI
jgi:hypothetical protein